MTLATIRAHVWRGGGDVMLYYKAKPHSDFRIMRPDQSPVISAKSRVGLTPPTRPREANPPPLPASGAACGEAGCREW